MTAEQVDSGHAGLVAYRNGEPLVWARFTPRSQLDWLLRRFSSYDFGNEAAWWLSCFFIARKARRQGVMTELIKFAAGWGRDHDTMIEGYPIDTGVDGGTRNVSLESFRSSRMWNSPKPAGWATIEQLSRAAPVQPPTNGAGLDKQSA